MIDPGVSNPEELLTGLRPGLKALVLSADEPAPAQIARAVAGGALEAVHVIAHGQPGAVAFSGGSLDVQALEKHQQELEAIGAALGKAGQLLLWCCRTAADAAGSAFVEALAQVTGVPVAAASSLVGTTAMGGSWQLDAEAGSGAKRDAPLTPAAIGSYVGLMVSYSEQTGSANPFAGLAVESGTSTKAPLSFGDIDGDGDLDVILGGSSNFEYFENIGKATAPQYILRTGAENPFDGINPSRDSITSLADIDGDGDLDAIIGNFAGTLEYLENTGTATAPDYIERTGTANPFNGIDVGYSSAPSFADIDGDGDLDAIVGDGYGYGESLKYFENTGTATNPAYAELTGAANPFIGIIVGLYSIPSFADIDGDGDLDSVVGNNDGTLSYLENAGTATAPAYIQRTGTANPFNSVDVGSSSAPGFADIDGDGDFDVVANDRLGFDAYGGNSLTFLEAASTPELAIYNEQTGADNLFNGIDVGNLSKPSFADIDRDGDLDVIVGDRDSNTLKYFENTGTATNPAYAELTGAANPFIGINVGYSSHPSFADIDGDGDLDVIVGNGIGRLEYLENTGTATAPAYIQRTGTANPFNSVDVGYSSAPSFADLDGDGDMDAIVGDRPGRLNYFENTGTALDPKYLQPTGTANPFIGLDVIFNSTPTFADIDGDGDLDAIIGQLSGRLSHFRNTGTATDPQFIELTGTANPFDIFNGKQDGTTTTPSVADIDGDGDLDAVIGNALGDLNFLLNVVCFLSGTLIATPTGERPIETLKPGDLICTAEGPQPVKFLSRTRRHRHALIALGKMPVRLRAGALGELGPSRDNCMSPSHAINLEGHLVEAGALLNGSSIRQLDSQEGAEFFTYYNIELEQHGLIWANGLPVETYFANCRGIGFTREDWDNYDDYIALYGSSELMQELPLPRIPFARLIPEALRQKFQLQEQPLLLLEQSIAIV